MTVEWAGLFFTILTAIVTAGWAVWRFTEDRRHHRRTERDRLAEVQNYLLGLLDHIEVQEGFTLFPKGRDRADRNRGWMDWAEQEGWIDGAEKERWVQSGASADEGRMRFANVGTR